VPVVSTRVDEKTKREMDVYADVNWSEVQRRAILARLEGERRKRGSRDFVRVREAVAVIDALRRECAGDTTAELRRWRKLRG
jgi:hypothetical protein